MMANEGELMIMMMAAGWWMKVVVWLWKET